LEKRYSRPEFDITPIIEERLQYLKGVREKLETEYNKMPEGSILVAPGETDNYYRYYLRTKPQDKIGIYLDASKTKIKKQYSIKKYCEVAIKEVDKELNKLEKICKIQPVDSIVTSYKKINQGVKKLIDPINIDDETYIKMWMNEPYERLGFNENDKTMYLSHRNERMRSKSEVIIANTLLMMGIPYKYECPIVTKDGKTLYPDFTILDVKNRKEKYWEHLGKMGDLSYVSRNIWKLDEYRKMDILLGINLFITYENEICTLRTSDIKSTIEAILR